MQKGKRRGGRRQRRSSQRRLTGMLCVATAALLAISGRLFTLQVVDAHALTAMAVGQRLVLTSLPASRGAILDREDRDLAISIPARNIVADPKLVTDPTTAASDLAPLLGDPYQAVLALLTAPNQFDYLARNVPVSVGNAVTNLHLPGVVADDASTRSYPQGSLAAQILGFVGIDGTGLAGLELQYQSVLAGHPGLLLAQVDPFGQVIPQTEQVVRPAVPGDTLVTTIDSDVQFVAEQALARAVQLYHAQGGSIVVEAPSSGQILAMANEPTFNPNDFAAYPAASYQNRAVSYVYEPGSVNKVITASAALEAHVVTPSTPITVPPDLPMCPGHAFVDAESHGLEVLPFRQVVAQSSNIGTIEVAQRLGRQRLAAAERAFGYGEPDGLNFPGENDGLVNPVSQWHCTDFGANAIGQGVAVTVMQMANVYATVANGGVWVQPSLVLGTMDAHGTFAPAPPPRRHRVIPAWVAHEMTGILEQVVKTGGTGVLAAMPQYAVAGKTGTAQIAGPNGYIPGAFTASFIGFVPAQHPAIVVAVVLDRPTPIYGGLVSAPTFKLVAQYVLAKLGVLPSGGGTAPPPPGTVIAGGDAAGNWIVPPSTAGLGPAGPTTTTLGTGTTRRSRGAAHGPPTTTRRGRGTGGRRTGGHTPTTTTAGHTTTTRQPATTTRPATTSTRGATTTTRKRTGAAT